MNGTLHAVKALIVLPLKPIWASAAVSTSNLSHGGSAPQLLHGLKPSFFRHSHNARDQMFEAFGEGCSLLVRSTTELDQTPTSTSGMWISNDGGCLITRPGEVEHLRCNHGAFAALSP